MSNAIKVAKHADRVVVRAAAHLPDRVEIAITDTGPGMTEEEIKIALEPYGQVKRPGHARRPGTGLGLPLARLLAEANGGSLTIESRPGVGTSLLVQIPQAPA